MVLLLHGFMSTSRMWSSTIANLERAGIPVWTPDLLSDSEWGPALSFNEWSRKLNRRLEEISNGEKCLIVGYSLGGRLALHALTQSPHIYSGALLLSVNPGFLSSEEAAERRTWEEHWQLRLMHEPIESVAADWNRQPVFSDSSENSDWAGLNGSMLALSLSNWSLTRHEFSLDQLKGVGVPMHWWFGAKDRKFLDVRDKMRRQNVPGEVTVIEGAGHRLPLDAATAVTQFILQMQEQYRGESDERGIFRT